MPFGPSHDLVGMDEPFESPPGPVFRWLPYPLLLTAFLLTVAETASGTPRPISWTAGLTLAAAAWSAVMLLPRRGVASHQGRYAAYLLVRTALTGALVLVAPWFGLFSWFGYVEAIRYFAPPRVYGFLVLNAVVTSLSYVGGVPKTGSTWGFYALVVVASTTLVSFFALAANRSRERDLERARTLAELTVANERLERALADNRALQDELVARARETGVLDERTRLAGEIHDTLAQALTGIVTQLDAAGPRAGTGAGARTGESSRSSAHVARARQLAVDGLAEARRSLHALRPSPLVGSRLVDAIGEAAGRWSTTTGVSVSVDVAGDAVGLPTDTEIALLRVAQEGLANVSRHAHASKVGVTLTYLDDIVLLDVRDDGVGFRPAATRAGVAGHHVGIDTMRERLRRVGGRLDVESEQGAGTALVARVPTR